LSCCFFLFFFRFVLFIFLALFFLFYIFCFSSFSFFKKKKNFLSLNLSFQTKFYLLFFSLFFHYIFLSIKYFSHFFSLLLPFFFCKNLPQFLSSYYLVILVNILYFIPYSLSSYHFKIAWGRGLQCSHWSSILSSIIVFKMVLSILIKSHYRM